MAERWEVVVDFTNYAGKNITVRNTKGFAADEDFEGTDRVMRKYLLLKLRHSISNNLQNSVLNLPGL
jgi:bilirubin oxidase